MISYFIAHFKISALLLVFALVIAKNGAGSNRFRLVLLYLILIKSVLPWGFIYFIPLSFQKSGCTGASSFDLPYDAGMAVGHGSIYSALNNELVIFIIWAFFFLLFLGFMLWSLFKLDADVKASRQCEDSVICSLTAGIFNRADEQRSVKVMVSPMISTPFIWWHRQWLIVLPESILSLNPIEKKVILAHEFTHIRRHDFIKFLLLKGIKAMFFFSPLVLFVINEIISREETETDLKAMKFFEILPKDFGKTLLHVLSISHSVNYPVPTLIKSTKRRLKMRLEGLFPKKMTRKNKWFQVSLAIAASAVLVLNFYSSAGAGKGAADKNFITPLAAGKITLGFGLITHPITKKPYQHNGIDLAAPMGTGIVSPAKGRVLGIDFNEKQGHVLILGHDNGYSTLYSHLSEIRVPKGRIVGQGDTIAAVGNSGLSTGPHLHFEIHKDSKAVDPEAMIQFKSSTSE